MCTQKKELVFKLPNGEGTVIVTVTVHTNLVGELKIITQIGDEPPLSRETYTSNTNIVMKVAMVCADCGESYYVSETEARKILTENRVHPPCCLAGKPNQGKIIRKAIA